MKPYTFIFDIDGTIADTSHRQHYMREKRKNWKAFYDEMVNDPPVVPTVRILESLKQAGYKIVLVSGRPNNYRLTTEQWLKANYIQYDALYMREEFDYRADNTVKQEIYNNFIEPNYNVIGVFEDRKRVKRMWVENNIFVFDVNQNDEEF